MGTEARMRTVYRCKNDSAWGVEVEMDLAVQVSRKAAGDELVEVVTRRRAGQRRGSVASVVEGVSEVGKERAEMDLFKNGNLIISTSLAWHRR